MSSQMESDDSDASRGLKRQATADLSFFTPSAASFKPKPYHPHPANAAARLPKPSTQPPPQPQREASSSSIQQKAPDVSPFDNDAVFIRYPFTAFPDAHLYQDGLTYSVLADNPNWFLDAEDFRTENDTDPNRVLYPQALEPPRGWCPLKKKDIKEMGSEAIEDDDLPKLRCTFCRRGYAGVNAKSMWRRHVLEKHKIPMANRRDGPGESTGRGNRGSSNKENKRSSSSAPATADNATIQPFFKQQDVFSGLLPPPNVISEGRPRRVSNARSRSSKSVVTDKVQPAPELPEDEEEPPSKPSEPEFAPNDDVRRSSTPSSPQPTGQMLPPSSPFDESRSREWRDLSSLLPSPLRTPGSLSNKRSHFMMPWKFPSPSHPLYTSPDELCLGAIGGMTGEGLSSSYVALQASPFPGTSNNQSQFSSPIAGSPLSKKPVQGRVLGWKRSKNKTKSKLPPLPEPSPRRPLYTGPLPVPMPDSLELTPTPDLTLSTDSEPDSSFSTFEESSDPFSSWLELNSPRRENKSLLAPAFPDTPLRRSVSSSAIERLQLVKSKKEEESAPSSLTSKLLPSGFGLGFNFNFDLRTSGSKRARSEDGKEEDNAPDEFAERLASATGPQIINEKAAGPSGHISGKSSLSSEFGDFLSIPDTPPTDVDSDDRDSFFGGYLPLKKRRLFE